MTTVKDADSRTFEAVILLYLACSKLPDGDLDEAEAHRILELTRRHTRELAPSYGERVVAQVSAELAQPHDAESRLAKVVEAAELLGRTLSERAKHELVDELTSIVAADGTLSSRERHFVRAVAKTFGLEQA
ncbi:MAG: TerB family tellurite resistance protein [Myxococcales bacterium]|nr:TerB family tellurite resistance protein [Myxococcales bacterium]MCB9715981.1 TerB family tellurite resistance protein [Myxococcales bacterium]